MRAVFLIAFLLPMSGCLLSTTLKSPTLVKWEETQVVLDTECRDTEKWWETCKSRFSKKEALSLAQKYCALSNRTAHPEYYWDCADTYSRTTCVTSEELLTYPGGPEGKDSVYYKRCLRKLCHGLQLHPRTSGFMRV